MYILRVYTKIVDYKTVKSISFLFIKHCRSVFYLCIINVNCHCQLAIELSTNDKNINNSHGTSYPDGPNADSGA